MAKRIDGKVISKQIKDELKEEVAQLKAKGIEGSLAVIQVGNDPASSVYVNNKKKACEYIGIGSISYELPEETTEAELLDIIEDLNKREDVCGILVQLPVPKHIDEDKIIQAISPKKDVDGFHPQSVGAMTIGEPGFLSCTPAGIIQLLKRSNIEIEGKHCVVIGRSNIVGKPMALLMLRENATVTIAHSKTKNLKELCKQADILIVAIGKPKFIDESYVKEGAVVIDVGIHRNEENKLCGDVDYDTIQDKCQTLVSEQIGNKKTLDKEEQNQVMENMELPDLLKNALVENNTAETYRYLAVSTFTEYISDSLAVMAVNGISFLISFVLSAAVIKLLGFILNVLTKLPVINGINKIAGAAVGGIKCIIFIWIAFLVLTLLCNTTLGQQGMALIQQDAFLNFLYSQNVFVKVFMSVFYGN